MSLSQAKGFSESSVQPAPGDITLTRPDANPYSSTCFEADFTEANFTFHLVYNTFNRFMAIYCKDSRSMKEEYIMFPFPDIWVRPTSQASSSFGIAATGSAASSTKFAIVVKIDGEKCIAITVPHYVPNASHLNVPLWIPSPDYPKISGEILQSVVCQLDVAIVELVMSV